jgi:hypothetical protein
MSDQEKAIAAWKTVVMFQHQDSPPREYLQNEEDLHDPIKLFNVYGYAMCCNASCAIEALTRHAGLQARGWGINGHSVPEVFYDGGWHLFDASLINYFPKADGKVASVEEIMAAVKDWHAKNPDHKGNDAKLRAYHFADGKQGWKKGPELLKLCPFYDDRGWWPAKSHGWYSTMQEFDGTGGNGGKAFLTEYGYAQGYQVNLRLRYGERLVRNWSHKGLHINMKESGGPGCLTMKTGSDSLVLHAEVRGTSPRAASATGLCSTTCPSGETTGDGARSRRRNLGERPRVKDPSKPGVPHAADALELRLPEREAGAHAGIPSGGSIVLSFSENNGLDGSRSRPSRRRALRRSILATGYFGAMTTGSSSN